jgi:DNA-binding MarR family transcriptional regulator
LGAELLSVIARLNRWATRQADLSLPPAQGRLLAQIDELGTARIGDLARADHCSQPTMTTQVQRLEERGWVSREQDPADARAVLISLTEQGRELLAYVRRRRAQVLAPYLDDLDDTERARIEDAVDVLRSFLDAVSAAARPTFLPAPETAPDSGAQEDN